MNRSNRSGYYFLLIVILALVFSCNGQGQASLQKAETAEPKTSALKSTNTKEQNAINFNQGVSCGLLDSKGNLWFGSYRAGVYRYDGEEFTQFTEANGFCNNKVFAIIEDSQGRVWFGTENGMCKYDPAAEVHGTDSSIFAHIPIPFSDTSSAWLDKVYPIINPNAVHALTEDRRGDIWVGTGGGGAYRFTPSASLDPASLEFTSFLSAGGRKQLDSLYHNWIPSITEDADGNMWFASMTRGGASRFDGKTIRHFMPKDGLSSDMVWTIFEDQSRNIWFGYKRNKGIGLTRYDGESFDTFYKEDGLCNNNIRVIYEDDSGNLWLGGDQGNLCIYTPSVSPASKQGSFREFRTKEGQSFAGILTIIGDAEGNVWFGGKYGLWQVDGNRVINMPQDRK